LLSTLPQRFKEFGLHADVRTLLILQKAMQRGLIKTLGDVYNVLKGIVVKEPTMMGPFVRAYYDYFLNIDIQNGERLEDAILRSETFRSWKEEYFKRHPLSKEEDGALINKFLDEVHLTSYDIKEIINGKELFDNDNPDLEDEENDSLEREKRHLDKMADYSGLSLEELLERLEKIREHQKSRHDGGSHWLGTGGISPYGHGGAAKGGIRVGGSGGGKMARKVMGDQNFFPVDMDRIINDDNVDAALASLNGIMEETAQDKLDIAATINLGIKRGGFFLPEIDQIKEKKLQVLLLIDNGGYSMTPFVQLIRELFKKMKTRFAHDMETYYFHNTIYDRVFSDPYRKKKVDIKKLLAKDSNYRVFIIGDASMAPYELNKLSLRTYQKLVKKFKKTVWLNPEPRKYWPHTFSINIIKEVVDMFPMTPRGIEQAVLQMNKKK